MRRNPKVGAPQLDLFGGKTRTFVPVADLSLAELAELPRSAFSDEEWRRLPTSLRLEIRTGDEESVRRVNRMVIALTAAADSVDTRTHDVATLEEDYWIWIAEVTDEEIVRRYAECNPNAFRKIADSLPWIGKAELTELVAGVLREDESVDRDVCVSSACFYTESVQDELYLWGDDLEELASDLFPDEATDAIEAFNGEYRWGLTEEDMSSLAVGQDVTKFSDTEVYFVGVVDDEHVFEETIEIGADYELSEDAPTHVRDDQIVHRWPDGYYLVSLGALDLPYEGKRMGMCIGDPSQGHMAMLAAGETEVYSLRRPGGKPLLTFEVALGHRGLPVAIRQIAGHSNRYPGFALDDEHDPDASFKRGELEKSIEVAELLGVDPRKVESLEPALRRAAADRRGSGAGESDRRKNPPRQRPVPRRSGAPRQGFCAHGCACVRAAARGEMR